MVYACDWISSYGVVHWMGTNSQEENINEYIVPPIHPPIRDKWRN